MLRREFLRCASLGASSLLLPHATSKLWAGPSNDDPLFRFVHLTDIHVQPEREASLGMAKCLRAVEQLDPRPDFILSGGDLVYDVSSQQIPRANMLFDLYKSVLKDNTDLPVYQCLGNHDILDWSSEENETKSRLAAKELYLQKLEQDRTYYAFDHKGWRFYVLDSIQPAPGRPFSYMGGIDEPQLEWLRRDLAAKPAERPAAVVSHIPILTVTALAKRPKRLSDDFYMTGGPSMYRNGVDMNLLLSKHNVKLALSGHIHELDRVDRGGVSFICDGAVCGGWWYGPNVDSGYEVQEGFGIVDIHADGRFEHRYHDYGWEAKVKTKE